MVFTKAKIFLALCLAACLGLGFGLDVPRLFLMGICAIVAVCISLGWKNKYCMVLGFLSMMFCAGAWWAQKNQAPGLEQYFGQKTQMKIILITDPEPKDKSLNALAELKEINGQAAEGEVVVVLSRYPEYSYGTLLEVKGKLQEADEFSRKDNVSGEVVLPQVVSAEPGHANRFKQRLYDLKKQILLAINNILPEPESGFMGGLLLGTKKIPQDIVNNFRTTGTAHIVAVSGFNVTIVAVFLDQLLRRFGRSFSFYASVAAIFGFVIITGASASVVRAGVMGTLALFATQAGRLYSSSNAIVFAAALMLLQKPTLLKFDIGFQLSFAALVGLLYVQPKLESFFPHAPGWIKNFAFPTLAAQISTTSLSLYHFGNFSLISVLANVLVLPLIPFAMLLGFLGVVAYFAWPILGVGIGTLAWIVLKYILWAISMCARVPLAALKNIPFPLWAFVVYNLILITVLIWKTKPKK